VWWQTIVPTAGTERTGYPTQKPLKLIDRIVRVHSNPGDVVLDFFAGSGTTGEAAARNGRDFVLVDQSEDALAVMRKRLAFADPVVEAASDL
jgi:site-specific DNA-methyltransferase (adenine-specific)